MSIAFTDWSSSIHIFGLLGQWHNQQAPNCVEEASPGSDSMLSEQKKEISWDRLSTKESMIF